MNRLAFKMKVKEGKAAEYEKRHAAIWPELHELLKKSGISEYSIFLDSETHTLFAYQKLENSGGSQDLGNQIIVQKWWKYMADIMETNEDHSPISKELKEVFYMP